MPRAITSGLWRDVDLLIKEGIEIKQLYCFVTEISTKRALINICYELETDNATNMEIEIMGRCGNSYFAEKSKLNFKAGKHFIELKDPKLWWPYGYGKPNLYDTTVKFYKDGKEVCSESLKTGIRKVRLERTDITDGINGNFEFFINDVQIMCKGSNWVPLDAFQSRDKERYAKAFELVKDIGCNILRCWGGNVYEDKEFYDICDENGIMIWQDFSMACHAYPQEEEFQRKMKEEAGAIIRLHRNHPSIILWSGDNECDQVIFYQASDPNNNIITRKTLARAVIENDTFRPYLPSSPFVSEEIAKRRDVKLSPEDHLWGPRGYYKSSFYTNSRCHFISETGYHGCPSLKSIEKFIDDEYIWPIYNNPQWNLHSTDMRGRDHRVLLMEKQVRQLFSAQNWDACALYSSILL